jgi:hypothetical protein
MNKQPNERVTKLTANQVFQHRRLMFKFVQTSEAKDQKEIMDALQNIEDWIADQIFIAMFRAGGGKMEKKEIRP